jgi:nucleoside-diphosphate-sugar epimerase
LVVHCAAVVNGRDTIERRPLDQVVDFELDAALFRWITQVDVKQTVYLSSSAAYPIMLQGGSPYALKEHDIDLDLPSLPDTLYGWTKLTGEMIAERARAAGHKVLIVRPFSGYGEDQSLDYPFPSIMRRAHEWHDPFKVWGTGNQVRDFVHVDDIVRAVMAFVEADFQGPVNIGTGRPTSMATLATMAAAHCGYVPTIEPHTTEPEGVMYRVADTTLMREFYEPQVDLESGIARALQALAQS